VGIVTWWPKPTKQQKVNSSSEEGAMLEVVGALDRGVGEEEMSVGR